MGGVVFSRVTSHPHTQAAGEFLCRGVASVYDRTAPLRPQTPLTQSLLLLSVSAVSVWPCVRLLLQLYGISPTSSSSHTPDSSAPAASSSSVSTESARGEESVVDHNQPQQQASSSEAWWNRRSRLLMRLRRLIRLALGGGALSPAAFDIYLLWLLVAARTLLIARLAQVGGHMIRALIESASAYHSGSPPPSSANSGNVAEVGEWLLRFLLLGLPAALLVGGLEYLQERIRLNAQSRITAYLRERYVTCGNFYKINHTTRENYVPSADLRMTSDVEAWCEQILAASQRLFRPVLNVLLYSGLLWRQEGYHAPLLLMGMWSMGWLIHGRLLRLASALPLLAEMKNDYAIALRRLILHSEEVAFYDGGSREKRVLDLLYERYYQFAHNLHSRSYVLSVARTYFNKYLGTALGYAAMCAAYLGPRRRGASLSAGQLLQRVFVDRAYMINLLKGMHELIRMESVLGPAIRLTDRLGSLLDHLDTLREWNPKPFAITSTRSRAYSCCESGDEARDSAETWRHLELFLHSWAERGPKPRRMLSEEERPHYTSRIGRKVVEGMYIDFQDATLVSPQGKLLVRSLNLSIAPLQNVMIVGPRGSGKTGLFRILGDLWPLHSGVVVKPPKNEIVFIPSRPYQVLGSLRDQIIYPDTVHELDQQRVADRELASLLSIADPENSILGTWSFDDTYDWERLLTPRQKQAISFARLFYQRPRYAMLDGCMDSLSPTVETNVFAVLARLGITVITTTQCPHLQRYHSLLLELFADGDYRLTEIAPCDHQLGQREEEEQHAAPRVAVARKSTPTGASTTNSESSPADTEELDTKTLTTVTDIEMAETQQGV